MKGLIMNILNYKKPSFLVVMVAVIVVVIVALGLMSNLRKEQVEDIASQFITEEIAVYEKSFNFKIIERISHLEKMAVFDEMLSSHRVENDFSTPVGQEIALREFLENMKLLPPEN